MSQEKSLKEIQKKWHGSLKSYILGFIGSLFLTSLSFLLALYPIFPGWGLATGLIFLGLIQAIYQLIFFLHLGQEEKPKWELITFYFMLLILLIVVLGSLWIMHDLNSRMMMEMP